MVDDNYDDLGWVQPACSSTYCWTEMQSRLKRHFSSPLVLAQRPGVSFRAYHPLEVDGLFLKFAELEPTPEGVLAFASRYGPLGFGSFFEKQGALGDLGPITFPGSRSHERNGHLLVEPFDCWSEEIVWMRHLTDLWGFASAGERSALTEFVRWEGDSIVFRWAPIKAVYLLSDEAVSGAEVWETKDYRGQDGRPLWQRGDLVGPALRFAQRHLDARLRHAGVGPRLLWRSVDEQPMLLNAPSSLLGALWLQFAASVADHDRGFRIGRCLRCGKRMPLAPGVNRSDKTTCSDSCRALLYRRRKEQAVEMATQGKTPKQIASELGSDLKTVQGWIKGSKKEK